MRRLNLASLSFLLPSESLLVVEGWTIVGRTCQPSLRVRRFDISRAVAVAVSDDSSLDASLQNHDYQENGDIKDKDRYRASLVDRFHQDMRRILQTKRDMMRQMSTNDYNQETPSWVESYAPFSPWFDDKETPNLIMTVDRKHRPPIISRDFDGAERVHQMLQVLRSKKFATAESYEIVMQAYLQRGRLRWFNDDQGNSDTSDDETLDVLFNDRDVDDGDDGEDAFSNERHRRQSIRDRNVVCAADVVDQLWQQLRNHVERDNNHDDNSNVAWNTASACWLASQAVCATPRGGRMYAQRAMDILESLRPWPPAEALLHGVHAAAWQQANLQGEEWARWADELWQELVQQVEKDEEEKEDEQLTYCLLACNNNRTFTGHDLCMQAAAWTLEAWSKSDSKGSDVRAQNILHQMVAWNATSSKTNLYLNAETYSNAILAHCKKGRPDRGQDLLYELMQLHRQPGSFPPHCSEPPLIAFNAVISAWCKQRETAKAVKVLQLLQQAQADCPGLVPNTVAYNSILYSFSQPSGRKEGQRFVSHANGALSLVRHMEQNQDIQPGIRPNAFTYHALIKCLLAEEQQRQRHQHSGSDLSFLSNDEMLQHVESALSHVDRLWRRGDRSVEPSNRIFNMVINAHAKSRRTDAARRAFAWLDRMKDSPKGLYKPDIITYTSVMDCLSKSTSPEAPAQALSLLQERLDEYEQSNHDPDDERLFLPNVRIFTMAILTLSQNHGRAQDARNVLTQLVELYNETQHEDLRPNAYPFNYVLNCAANAFIKEDGDGNNANGAEQKAEVFRIAAQTFQEMRKSPYAQPDSFTYGFWLKCCNKLLSKSSNRDLRIKCIQTAFEDCKRQGLMSNEVLNRLYQGRLPVALMDQLLEQKTSSTSPPLRVGDLPPSWSRNTRTRKTRTAATQSRR